MAFRVSRSLRLDNLEAVSHIGFAATNLYLKSRRFTHAGSSVVFVFANFVQQRHSDQGKEIDTNDDLCKAPFDKELETFAVAGVAGADSRGGLLRGDAANRVQARGRLSDSKFQPTALRKRLRSTGPAID